MELSGDVNRETGMMPEFFIGYHTADYSISGTDGLLYNRKLSHGFPDIRVRGSFGGGYLGSKEATDVERIYEALNVLSFDNYTQLKCQQVQEILTLMPEKIVIRDEHGCLENTVTFFNREKSGGIGIFLNRPFFDSGDYWTHKEQGTPIDEDHIQESHFLVVPNGSHEFKAESTESILYATTEQMQAILNLSLALSR